MRLVSKKEFAALAGVSQPAITKACRRQLRSAMVRDRIDLDAPVVAEYLARHGLTVPQPPPEPPEPLEPPPPGRAGPPDDDVPADIAFYRQLPFGEVMERFGTDRAMRDWLLALKELETVREKRFRVQAARGELISRDLVRTHIVGALDACNRHLLNEGAQAIVARLFDLALSGSTREAGEEAICDIISQHLNVAYDQVSRVLSGNLSARLSDSSEADQPEQSNAADAAETESENQPDPATEAPVNRPGGKQLKD